MIEIQDTGRIRVGRIRARSAIDHLIRALTDAPIATVTGAGDLISCRFQHTDEGTARPVRFGVLARVPIGRRHRAFEASEIVDASMDVERQLTRPDGDRVVQPTHTAGSGIRTHGGLPFTAFQVRPWASTGYACVNLTWTYAPTRSMELDAVGPNSLELMANGGRDRRSWDTR